MRNESQIRIAFPITQIRDLTLASVLTTKRHYKANGIVTNNMLSS